MSEKSTMTSLAFDNKSKT